MRIASTLAGFATAAFVLALAAGAQASPAHHKGLLLIGSQTSGAGAGKVALNPQPEPPGIAVMLNPQPLPPGYAVMINPQPLPPRW